MLGYSNVGIPDKSWQPPVAVLETTMGTIILEMYWKHSPNTCRNFMELVRRGYYNNTKFHRVIRDFMIQGGDPTGTGKGGQSIYGPTFDDEITNDLKHTGAGVLSMANAGPCTNGSQFFITLAPTQWLDGKHTIFGRVQGGMPVVKRIGLVECDKNDCPVDDVKIERAILKLLYLSEGHANNFYYDTDATQDNEQEPAWNSGLNDNSVIVITNPSEARLPADTISVKLLRETMEARAKAARFTPSTTKLSWKTKV